MTASTGSSSFSSARRLCHPSPPSRSVTIATPAFNVLSSKSTTSTYFSAFRLAAPRIILILLLATCCFNIFYLGTELHKHNAADLRRTAEGSQRSLSKTKTLILPALAFYAVSKTEKIVTVQSKNNNFPVVIITDDFNREDGSKDYLELKKVATANETGVYDDATDEGKGEEEEELQNGDPAESLKVDGERYEISRGGKKSVETEKKDKVKFYVERKIKNVKEDFGNTRIGNNDLKDDPRKKDNLEGITEDNESEEATSKYDVEVTGNEYDSEKAIEEDDKRETDDVEEETEEDNLEETTQEDNIEEIGEKGAREGFTIRTEEIGDVKDEGGVGGVASEVNDLAEGDMDNEDEDVEDEHVEDDRIRSVESYLSNVEQYNHNNNAEEGEISTITHDNKGEDDTSDMTKVWSQKLFSLDSLLRLSPPSIIKEKAHAVSLLKDADSRMLIESKVFDDLPTWQQLSDLYYAGSSSDMTLKAIVHGLDTCAIYRQRIPLKDRYLGVAGLFNTGTNALAWMLEHNIVLPGYHHSTRWQVPWGKHRLAIVKWNHTAPDGLGKLNKTNVLPIVIIKDPFYWLQSMCRSPYEAHWRHRESHCPNLVPTSWEQHHFIKALKHSNGSIPVKIDFGKNSSVLWPSLIHLYNDWYRQYLLQLPDNSPRLMVRFEDLLFAPRQMLQQVATCVLGDDLSAMTITKSSQYIATATQYANLYNSSASLFHKISSSKSHGSQTDLVHALTMYGSGRGRLRNMTTADLEFAHKHLNKDLMTTFQYPLPNTAAAASPV